MQNIAVLRILILLFHISFEIREKMRKSIKNIVKVVKRARKTKLTEVACRQNRTCVQYPRCNISHKFFCLMSSIV